MTMYKEEVDSDNEIPPDFYFPRKFNTRANAIKRLQHERENEFVASMLGSLQSAIQDDKAKGDIEQDTKVKFDPIKLTSNCISSWKDERRSISSSISQHKKQAQRASEQENFIRGKNIQQFRPEPAALELNSFLQTLSHQIGEAAIELENVPRMKFMIKDEDILSRPSQLAKLVDVMAGTEEDELKNARKSTLWKLSKTCAYWMTSRNTPKEHRPAVQKELEEVHGYFTEEEVFENELDKDSKELESLLNASRF